MLLNKFIIGLVFLSSCMAMPEPDANIDTDLHMNVHVAGGGQQSCGTQDPEAECVWREPYWGDCPPNMHCSEGSCPNPADMICCAPNPICGNYDQGQCNRKNATIDDCPRPLFRQSTRHSPPGCLHESSCCADLPDPHCHCNHWGYVGMCGERGWFGLCPEYCDGDIYQSQSPINIKDAEVKTTVALTCTNYDKQLGDLTCENNGHFAVCYWEGIAAADIPTISDGALTGTYQFEMMQFHIGCKDGIGSEHLVDDMSYSGELHLIHYKDTYDNYTMALESGVSDAVAILGIFIHVNDTTPDNTVYDPFCDNLVYIVKRYEETTFSFNHTLSDFLPTNTQPFVRYDGSLTSPSCNNVVVWTVFLESTSMSMYQIRPFRCMLEGHGSPMCDNFRPPQPLNGRQVYEY